MYVTNKLVRFQKNEIRPLIDYIFRAISFLSSETKIKVFVTLLLQFVVRPNSSISGHELRTAFVVSDQVKHHEMKKPEMKNAKGLYFRRFWVKKDPEAIDEWKWLVHCAAQDALVMIWDEDRRIESIMMKIKTCGITPHEYREIRNWVCDMGFNEDRIPPVHECEIISLADLEVA